MQSGFRAQHSTETALLSLLSDIYTAMISKNKTTKDSDKVVQEPKQEKAVTSQRKGRVLLVDDSLVRHVGRNLQQQCV